MKEVMPIDKAISLALRTVPLPLSDANRQGINDLLRWQHDGSQTVTREPRYAIHG